MPVLPIRRRSVAVAALGALIATCGVVGTQASATAAPAAPAGPAAATAPTAKLSAKGLYATTTVTSSTHKKLHLALNGNSSGSSSSMAVTLTRGPETHSWQFRLTHTGFVATAKLGGHLRASYATTHHYAHLDLSFARKGRVKKSTCTTGNYDVQAAVAVKGTLSFSTKTTGHKGWGTVHIAAKKKPLSGELDDTYGQGGFCHFHTPCAASTSWNLQGSGANSSTFIGGESQGRKGLVFAAKSVQLGSYGSRQDEVAVAAPEPRASGSGASTTYSVTTSKGGPTKGSLTFKATGAPSEDPQTCYVGKKKGTQTASFYPASVTSHGFAVTEQLFGSFKIPDQGQFSITKVG